MWETYHIRQSCDSSNTNFQLAALKTLYHRRLKEVGRPCDNEINSTSVYLFKGYISDHLPGEYKKVNRYGDSI